MTAAGWASVHEFAADPGIEEGRLPSGAIFHELRAGDQQNVNAELFRGDRLEFADDGSLTVQTGEPRIAVFDGDRQIGEFDLQTVRGGMAVEVGTAAQAGAVRALVATLVTVHDHGSRL